MAEDLLSGDPPVAADRTRRTGDRGLDLGLRVVTAAALGIDAYVHVHDARYYDAAGGGAITQGDLFRIEAAGAAVTALVLLAWWHRAAWLLALGVAASALGALLLYRYVDVGVLGPLPDMYEPTWAVPGKSPAAWAEGVAVLTASVGLARAYLPRFLDVPVRGT